MKSWQPSNLLAQDIMGGGQPSSHRGPGGPLFDQSTRPALLMSHSAVNE